MAKKKPKGHEAEAFGYRITTEAVGNGWSVTISHKPKPDAKARIVAERDGFDFEGQALDWGNDWALENRPYPVEVTAADKGGFIGKVLDASGFDVWRSGACSDGDEAQAMCDAFVHARRQHDQLVLAERRKLRANARMLEADYRATEVEALGAIDEAKATLKAVEKDREQLRRDLDAPQIEFNFISELERQKVKNLRGLGPKSDVAQVDLEVKDGEAPTPV